MTERERDKSLLARLEELAGIETRLTPIPDDSGPVVEMDARKLIREIREEAVDWGCVCPDMAGGKQCFRCKIIEMIDEGLALIGESAKSLKRKSSEAMRGGNMTGAIKLYNRAWEKEKKEGSEDG